MAVSAGRYVTHARRRRRVRGVRRLGLGRLAVRRSAGLIYAAVVQTVEQGPHHHRDGDREHRELGAACGPLTEFGIDLQIIVETVETRLTANFVVAHPRAV